MGTIAIFGCNKRFPDLSSGAMVDQALLRMRRMGERLAEKSPPKGKDASSGEWPVILLQSFSNYRDRHLNAFDSTPCDPQRL